MKKSCEEYQLLIDESVSGALDRESEALLAAHVKDCTDCASVLSFTASLARMLRSAPDPEPPEDFERRVLRKLEPKTAERTSDVWVWSPAVALVSMLVAIGGFVIVMLYVTPLSVLLGWSQEVYYRYFAWTGAEPVLRALAERLPEHIAAASSTVGIIAKPLGDLFARQVFVEFLIVACAVLAASVLVTRFLVAGFGGIRLRHADS
jgi:predicted anti-sigma-YlaC factor YlaD